MPTAAALTIPSDPAKLAYIAGLIDGEGCIDIARRDGRLDKGRNNRGIRHVLRVHISNTDVRILKWLVDTLGGSIHWVKPNPTKRHRLMGNWACAGRNVELLLQAVAPYIVGKRDQVDIALAFRAITFRKCLGQHQDRKTGRPSVPLEIVARRDELTRALKAIKAS